jgi:hypothetical protein
MPIYMILTPIDMPMVHENMNMSTLLTVKGVPRWDDRLGQYGIKVSFWGSGTLKIVILILVENHP